MHLRTKGMLDKESFVVQKLHVYCWGSPPGGKHTLCIGVCPLATGAAFPWPCGCCVGHLVDDPHLP